MSHPRSFRPTPAVYPDRQSARALWQSTAQDVLDYAAGLTDAALEQTPPGLNEPAWLILLHLLNHGTDHRAQVLHILHDFGALTFDQDLMIYAWGKKR